MKRTSFLLELLGAIFLCAGGGLWCAQLLIDPNNPLPSRWASSVLLVTTLLLLGALVCRRREGQRAQQRLHTMQAQMQALVAAHATELSQLALSAQEELERLRSELAHGLRMPIAIVQGYAELLHGGLVDSEEVEHEYLAKIIQRTQYMSEVLSKQFSTLSSAESASAALTYCTIDLIELVRQVVEDIQTAAAGQGVTVQIVSPESEIWVDADAYQINRVFFNLLENSIKYMGRDGMITIRLTQGGNSASIMVKDDGLGLPTEETAHIFDPRYQGSNRLSGSGHGLHLVRSTIEAHGGTVSAESEPGRGMGIFLTLPIHSTAKAR